MLSGSVEAVQDKETVEVVVPVTARLVGTVGGVVSEDTVTVVWALVDPPLLVAVKV